MQELTEKQDAAYQYIKRFIDSNAYAPSLQEIAAHLSIAPTVARVCYVEVLERKGYIKRIPGKARAMRVLK